MSWTWSDVPALGGPFNTLMKSLENYLNRIERTLPVRDGARRLTTDGTATVLCEFEVPVNQTLRIDGCVVARRTGGSSGATNDGASYTVRVTGKNTGGTAAVVGSTITADGESQVGWDVTTAVSGAKVQVKVTGAVNNNVLWLGHFKTLAAGS
jgi:hypothetical protein